MLNSQPVQTFDVALTLHGENFQIKTRNLLPGVLISFV